MSERGYVDYTNRAGAPARTAYLRCGSGPAVVFVHGVGMQAHVWREQIEALRSDFDVVALDMLGHGGSTRPPQAARLSDYAAQLAALFDGLKLGQAHLVGHSMGALVALEFALLNPDRLQSVTAMNAVFCRSFSQRAAVLNRMADLDVKGPADWRGTISRWFDDPIPDAWQTPARAARGFLDAIDVEGYAAAYRVFATADEAHRDKLGRLDVPAMFMTGADDPNSLPEMAREMAALAPMGFVEVVPGERHMMSTTAPTVINRHLIDFFATAERLRPLVGARAATVESQP